MRTRVLVRTALIVGALAIACPSAARAGTIRLDSDFIGLNIHYQFNGELAQPITLGPVQMSNGAELNDTLNAPAEFEAYCADILTDILNTSGGQPDVGGTYGAEADLMSNWTDPNNLPSPADGRLRAAWLYQEYADGFADTDDLEGRTALQLAIWDVLYDTDFSVTTVNPAGTGTFSISLNQYDAQGNQVLITDPAQIAGYNAIAARANTFLDTVRVADLTGIDAAWIKLDAGATPAQDFIGPAKTVPEPGSLLLLGTGLGAIGIFRSRKLRPLTSRNRFSPSPLN
jgi:hypothetical protein